MNLKRTYFGAFTLLGLTFLAGSVIVARTSPQETQQPLPDNTKTNKRDNNTSPTADQQKMNPADRTITKKIRMALHDDTTLSTYAHNIKIVTQDGKVTLKGPVRSEEEKANIATKAIAVAGDGNVDNQLDVVPPKQ